MSLYTADDVERAALAAHRRNCEDSWDDCREYGGHCVRAAEETLDAVAPAIAARALREFAYNNVKAQTAGRVTEDLHARADEIEANI